MKRGAFSIAFSTKANFFDSDIKYEEENSLGSLVQCLLLKIPFLAELYARWVFAFIQVTSPFRERWVGGSVVFVENRMAQWIFACYVNINSQEMSFSYWKTPT